MADPVTVEAITLAAVAIHDVDCPDTSCSGVALGHCYRLARAALEAAAAPLQRETAARFYRDVRREMDDYTDHERDIIGLFGFAASLDQLAVEAYGLTREEMEDD